VIATQTLREVRLYGPLRARFGRSHWLAVDSPAEAVRALSVLFDGFRAAVLGHKGPGYRVIVGEGSRADHRDADTLTLRSSPGRVIRIAPVLHGRKSGWGTLIAGVVLYLAAPYLAAAYEYAVAGAAINTYAYAAAFTSLQAVGVAMALGGAVQLLSPQRVGPGSPAERETSYLFDGPVNVDSPGGPVPLIIGRTFCGSVKISSGIGTDDIAVPAPPTDPAPQLPPEQPPDPFWGGGSGESYGA